jgi:hypothetical protein
MSWCSVTIIKLHLDNAIGRGDHAVGHARGHVRGTTGSGVVVDRRAGAGDSGGDRVGNRGPVAAVSVAGIVR